MCTIIKNGTIVIFVLSKPYRYNRLLKHFLILKKIDCDKNLFFKEFYRRILLKIFSASVKVLCIFQCLKLTFLLGRLQRSVGF